ncbi:hypothetical protein CEXT_611441, partial [Caerostris extrusa]
MRHEAPDATKILLYSSCQTNHELKRNLPVFNYKAIYPVEARESVRMQ